MYPDTDSAPIPIGPALLEKVRAHLPRSPTLWRERYGAVLSEELLNQLLDRKLMETFHHVLTETGCDPALLAYTLIATLARLARAASPKEDAGREAAYSVTVVGGIHREGLVEVFSAYGKGLLTREAIPEALKACASSGPESASGVVATEDEIRNRARKLLLEGLVERCPSHPGPPFPRVFQGPRSRDKMRDWLIGRVKERLGTRASGGKTRGIVERLLDSYEKGGEAAQ